MNPIHTTRPCSFSATCNHDCKSSSKASYQQVQLVVHSLVTVFTSAHHTGKSYCLQTLSPLKTAVLANTLLYSLIQLNTLYADLHMGISNYWIHLDQFNVMLLDKYKQKEQLKMSQSSKKKPICELSSSRYW